MNMTYIMKIVTVTVNMITRYVRKMIQMVIQVLNPYIICVVNNMVNR